MSRPPAVKKMTRAEGDKHNIDRFPSFHRSGSITGMRNQYYGQDALLVRCGSYIYKVDLAVYNAAKPMRW